MRLARESRARHRARRVPVPDAGCVERETVPGTITTSGRAFASKQSYFQAGDRASLARSIRCPVAARSVRRPQGSRTSEVCGMHGPRVVRAAVATNHRTDENQRAAGRAPGGSRPMRQHAARARGMATACPVQGPAPPGADAWPLAAATCYRLRRRLRPPPRFLVWIPSSASISSPTMAPTRPSSSALAPFSLARNRTARACWRA